MNKIQITVTAPLLAALFLFSIPGCTGTQRLLHSYSQTPLHELTNHFCRKGKFHHEAGNYFEAIKNLKLAYWLDQASFEHGKLLKSADILFHEQHRKKLEDAGKISVKLAQIHWAYLEEQRQRCDIDLFVGGKLMLLDLYEKARYVFSEGLDRVRWYPYPFDCEGHYEQAFKSAIAECERKLSSQSNGDEK